MPTVRQRHGRTDRQTDRRTDGRLTIAIPRFALRASRGKKHIWVQCYVTDCIRCDKPTRTNCLWQVSVLAWLLSRCPRVPRPHSRNFMCSFPISALKATMEIGSPITIDCTEHATDELVGLWRFRCGVCCITCKRERLWAANSVSRGKDENTSKISGSGELTPLQSCSTDDTAKSLQSPSTKRWKCVKCEQYSPICITVCSSVHR